MHFRNFGNALLISDATNSNGSGEIACRVREKFKTRRSQKDFDLYFRAHARLPFSSFKNRSPIVTSVHVEMTLLSRLSRFSLASVGAIGVVFFFFRDVSHERAKSISRACVYSARNNNSITGRLFQSKEASGISLHSQRRNARRESSSAICMRG